MDNTIQLYVDKEKEIKGYPITSPDRVIDENGVNIKDYVDEAINDAKLEGGNTQVDLSTYAKKTDLHDHSNKTILDSITTSKINEWDNKSDFSGNYNDLTNAPTIPTKTSQLTNDSGYITSVPSEYVTDSELNNKGYLTEHQDISGKVDKVSGYSLISDTEISRLATLENYDDTDIKNALNSKANKTDLHSHGNKSVLDGITSSKVTEWDNKSTFSGNYNDLTNKPTIPSLNGYATEQYVNEEIKKIDVTEQLTDYAKKSELHSHSNKSVLDGITSAKITEWNNKSTFDGNYNSLTNKPTIPTKTSQLTNDSGFITSIPNEYITETELNSKGYLTEHQDISGKVDKINGYSLVSDAEISRLATLENYNDTEVRELINETNTLLENITNRVEYIENNGTGGGFLNLRDVLDGEIFTIRTIDTPTTPTVTYGQIVVSKSSTTITEGSTDTFTVKLDKAPTNNQVVTLNKNNSDVTLSSYSLTFTPSNYSTAQTVTITVAEDDIDYSNETCTISISSPNVSTKTLIVNITDNDTEVIEPEEPTASYTNYIYNSDIYTNPKDLSQHAIPTGNASIYWQNYLSTKTVSNGVATVLFNSDKGFFQCKASIGDGKTYYFSFLVDTASSSYVKCQLCSKTAQYIKDLDNGWTLYAVVTVDSNFHLTTKIEDKRASDWTSIQTKEWMKVCLTDLYPDGNYPSIEECSTLFKYVSGIKG